MLLFTAPLHSLRKTKLFQYLLRSRLNVPNLYSLGYNHRVALRPLTHASIRLRKQHLEPGICELITRIAKELDKQIDTAWFFDIGANVGLYTWEVHRTCPFRKIMAFEPDPDNFKLLEMTRKEAEAENVELCPNALSNQASKVSFFQDPLTSATGCIRGNEKPWIEQHLNGSSNEITVETCTLDSVVLSGKTPSLIKIDVEGHEIEVLQGGKDMLSKIKPLFIFESFPPKQAIAVSLLKEYGYKLIDADLHLSVSPKTTNLFAWHPKGPLKEPIIQKLIRK